MCPMSGRWEFRDASFGLARTCETVFAAADEAKCIVTRRLPTATVASTPASSVNTGRGASESTAANATCLREAMLPVVVLLAWFVVVVGLGLGLGLGL